MLFAIESIPVGQLIGGDYFFLTRVAVIEQTIKKMFDTLSTPHRGFHLPTDAAVFLSNSKTIKINASNWH